MPFIRNSIGKITFVEVEAEATTHKIPPMEFEGRCNNKPGGCAGQKLNPENRSPQRHCRKEDKCRGGN
ncbi:unnamed protein product [Ilex paraguariensis]|uniref:Uncharacterized protein n=1 Tax=Ilex paraguariensis TaxID=185542 RepID=A0ABC8RDY8_9AQUA